MPSDFKINNAARNAACNAIVDLLDAGAAGGRIEIRTGAPPAAITDASSGTLLGTLTFSAEAFGNAAAGVATSAAITSDTNAAATGTAGYFRCYHDGAADTAAVLEGTAGEAADTPDMVFDESSIVAGGTIAIALGGMTVTVPEQ